MITMNPRAAALLAVLLLAGCATTTKKPVAPPPPSFSQLMQQAEARYAAQDVDGAKALFAKAAAADPTRETPWYRLAQINFDQQNYGRAIVDAQEVLQRNASDTNAESILTIAGLRVAVDALGRLHDEVNLQGPAHAEAAKLAAKMRETLGQDVLVPPAAKPVRRAVRRKAVRDEAAGEAAGGASAKKPSATAPASAGNPFQGLPGGGM